MAVGCLSALVWWPCLLSRQALTPATTPPPSPSSSQRNGHSGGSPPGGVSPRAAGPALPGPLFMRSRSGPGSAASAGVRRNLSVGLGLAGGLAPLCRAEHTLVFELCTQAAEVVAMSRLLSLPSPNCPSVCAQLLA